MSQVNWDNIGEAARDSRLPLEHKQEDLRELLHGKKYHEALKLLEGVYKEHPNDLETINLLVHCKKELGQDRSGLESLLRKCLKIHPNDIMSNFQLGEFLYEEGKFEEAIKYYLNADHRMPGNGKVLYQIGYTYQRLKNYSKASEYYQKAIEVDPRFRKPYINAFILDHKFHTGKPEHLEEDLKKHNGLAPKTLNNLNLPLFEDPTNDKAVKDNFQKVLSIDSGNQIAQYNKAVFYFLRNSYDKAQEIFTSIIEKLGKDSKSHPILIFSILHNAIIQEEFQEYSKASDQLKDAMNRIKGIFDASDIQHKIERLAKLKAEMDARKQAEADLKKSIENENRAQYEAEKRAAAEKGEKTPKAPVIVISKSDNDLNSQKETNQLSHKLTPEPNNILKPESGKKLKEEQKKLVEASPQKAEPEKKEAKKDEPKVVVVSNQKDNKNAKKEERSPTPKKEPLDKSNNKDVKKEPETPKQNGKEKESPQKKDSKVPDQKTVVIISQQKEGRATPEVEKKDDKKGAEKANGTSPEKANKSESKEDKIQEKQKPQEPEVEQEQQQVEKQEERQEEYQEENQNGAIVAVEQNIVQPEKAEEQPEVQNEQPEEHPEQPNDEQQQLSQHEESQNIDQQLKDEIPEDEGPSHELDQSHHGRESPSKSEQERQSPTKSEQEGRESPLKVEQEGRESPSKVEPDRESPVPKSEKEMVLVEAKVEAKSEPKSEPKVDSNQGSKNPSKAELSPNRSNSQFFHERSGSRTKSQLDISNQRSRLEKSKSHEIDGDKETCLKQLQEDPKNFDALMRLAVILVEEKKYQEAQQRFMECKGIDVARDSDEINTYLCMINRKLKKITNGLEFLQKIQDIDKKVRPLTEKAACEEKLGNNDKAKDLYSAAMELHEPDWMLYMRYGWFLVKTGDIVEGLHQLLSANSWNKNNIKIKRKLGRACLISDEDRIEDALECFEYVHRKDPNDYAGLLGLGQVYEKKGDFEKALKYLQRAVAHPKADIHSKYFLGQVYAKTKEFKKAAELFKDVCKEEPSHIEAIIELGTILTMVKDYDRAKKYFKQAIKIEPSNVTANLRYEPPEYETAIECYERILATDHKNVKALYQLGLVYMSQKNLHDAQEKLRAALKVNPSFAPAWKALGSLLFEANRIEAALQYLNQAEKLEPNDLETKTHIGNCYYELQQNDKAIQVYLEVLKIEETADIHYNLGNFSPKIFKLLANAYYVKEELDQAIHHYKASLAKNPDRAECWYNLGNTYCLQGDYTTAIEKFKKAIELDPKNVAAYYNLGNAYLISKDIEQAINSFEEALQHDPDNLEWKVMVGGIYLEKKDYDKSLKLAKEVLLKDGNNLEAIMLEAQSLEGKGEKVEALKYAKKVKLLSPNFEGIDDLIQRLQA